MNYTTVKNPKWANAEHTLIDCEVDFDDLQEAFVPFTATMQDPHPHTIEIFQRCLNGEFGQIAEFVAEVKSDEVLADEIRCDRNRLLLESDWTQLPDVPETTRIAWASYRQALRDVTTQPGFPTNIQWPERP